MYEDIYLPGLLLRTCSWAALMRLTEQKLEMWVIQAQHGKSWDTHTASLIYTINWSLKWQAKYATVQMDFTKTNTCINKPFFFFSNFQILFWHSNKGSKGPFYIQYWKEEKLHSFTSLCLPPVAKKPLFLCCISVTVCLTLMADEAIWRWCSLRSVLSLSMK